MGLNPYSQSYLFHRSLWSAGDWYDIDDFDPNSSEYYEVVSRKFCGFQMKFRVRGVSLSYKTYIRERYCEIHIFNDQNEMIVSSELKLVSDLWGDVYEYSKILIDEILKPIQL